MSSVIAAIVSNEGAFVMNQPKRLTPEELKKVVEATHALRTIDKLTGVHTQRRIGLLLDSLCVDDVVLVSKELELLARAEQQRRLHEMPRNPAKKQFDPKGKTAGTVRFDAQGKPEANYNR